jgi:hypothetical protein
MKAEREDLVLCIRRALKTQVELCVGENSCTPRMLRFNWPHVLCQSDPDPRTIAMTRWFLVAVFSAWILRRDLRIVIERMLHAQ